MGSTGQVTAGRGARVLARAAAVAPFTGRERRELLFCLTGLPFGLLSPLVLFVLGVNLVRLVTGAGRANPSPADITAAFAGLALLLGLLVATGSARGLGSLQRLLATRLLGAPIAAPPPVRRRRGELGRLAGHRLPAAQAAGRAARAVRGVLLGRRAGQPELSVLVGGVPQPPARVAAEPGAGLHAVRLVRRGHVPRRHPPRHLRRSRGGGRDAARRPVGDQGDRVRGPLADPEPARPWPAGAARARPGAEPGAGCGRLRRPAAAARAGPA